MIPLLDRVKRYEYFDNVTGSRWKRTVLSLWITSAEIRHSKGLQSSSVLQLLVTKLIHHIREHNLENPHQSAYKKDVQLKLLCCAKRLRYNCLWPEVKLLRWSGSISCVWHHWSFYTPWGTVFKWFTLYPTPELYSVVLQLSTLSDCCKLLFGEKQGYVLFSLYTTELNHISAHWYYVLLLCQWYPTIHSSGWQQRLFYWCQF